jgi:hypothetical protein
MRAHYRVVGRLGRAPVTPGTVTITRDSGLFTVRARRARKTWTLPLSTVAELVVARVARLEADELRRSRRASHRRRRPLELVRGSPRARARDGGQVPVKNIT